MCNRLKKLKLLRPQYIPAASPSPHLVHLLCPTKCHPNVCVIQEKETATKIASDAAATPQRQVDGEPANSTSGTAPGQVSVATGGGADLDDYIKNLLSMPAPGGSTEVETTATPPDPGDVFFIVQLGVLFVTLGLTVTHIVQQYTPVNMMIPYHSTCTKSFGQVYDMMFQFLVQVWSYRLTAAAAAGK